MKSFHIFALLALFVLIVVYNNRTKEGNTKPRRRGAAGGTAGTANMYGGGNINSKKV
jgi:hypothetical protein